jgi:hypothetical protein
VPIDRTLFKQWLAEQIAQIAGENWWEDDELTARLITLQEIQALVNANHFDTKEQIND